MQTREQRRLLPRSSPANRYRNRCARTKMCPTQRARLRGRPHTLRARMSVELPHVTSSAASDPRPRRGLIGIVGVIVAFILIMTSLLACSSTEEDPAEQSRRRMTERLEETFSGDQASCVVGELDIETIDALLPDHDDDRDDDDDRALEAYSQAIRTCMLDGDDD